jgi:uncharacterized protein (DUF1800 family)
MLPMPITPYTGTFGTTQLTHLLRRTMYGVKKADLTFFAGKSMDEVVTTLLTPPATLTNPLNYYGPTTTPLDTSCAYGETWVNSPIDSNFDFTPRSQSFLGWWLGAMAYQERSIHWRMVMFWYNHLPVSLFNGINIAHHAFDYIRHIQTYALGNFKAFIKANATTYAMLDYLNGYQNTKGAANENYGRELQELFTVGKDLDPHYTEDDVKAAARVMTGWTYVTSDTNPVGPRYTPYFNASQHGTENKTFSNPFYGGTVITGRTGATAGDLELTDMMNMIFAHPEVARYIVRKVYRYFVYYDITADVETNVIVPLADTFRSSGYDIPTVMRALLTSAHFYDAARMGCLIKSPLDYILSAVRTFNMATTTNTADYYTTYRQYIDLYNACVSNRMRINQAPNVAGWPAYYTAPTYHELWINADTLRQRTTFVNQITTGSGYYSSYKIDTLAFTATMTTPADPNALIEEVLSLTHPLPVDATVKAALKKILLGTTSDDHYWTDAWNAYVGAPTNTKLADTVRNKLKPFYQAILNMAEFDLC